MPELNLEKLRADTPACAELIHFNNAGAALMPQPVVDTMQAYLSDECRLGGYETAEKWAEFFAQGREDLASLLGAEPESIAFTHSATDAFQRVFSSLDFEKCPRILVCQSSYGSEYLAALQRGARQPELSIEVIPSDSQGATSLSALDKMLKQPAGAVLYTHIPTNNGLVNPSKGLKQAIAGRAPLIVDACQTLGQRPIDVKAWGCDALTATSRKFLRGPRGAGLLYLRPGFIEQLQPQMADLLGATWQAKDSIAWAQGARRMENFERSYIALAGMCRAARYALDLGIETIQERIQNLAETLRNQLRTLPNCRVHDAGQEQCGIVSFSFDGRDSQTLKKKLQQGEGERPPINISLSLTSYTRLDSEARSLPEAMLRASVHVYNTLEEIETMIGVLSKGSQRA